MSSPWREIIIIAIVTVCTVLTRLLRFLGKALPPAVIAILIIYCVRSCDFLLPASILPQAISIAVVALLHLWKRNNLLSIGLGTVCYMVLVQAVF